MNTNHPLPVFLARWISITIGLVLTLELAQAGVFDWIINQILPVIRPVLGWLWEVTK